MKLQMKRTYEALSASDGFRVLADRLWPRGIKKEDAHLDFWAKETAPSTDLRKEYHGGEIDFEEFRKKYLNELKQNPATVDLWKKIKDQKTVTLLTSVKEIPSSELPVLKEFLEKNYLK